MDLTWVIDNTHKYKHTSVHNMRKWRRLLKMHTKSHLCSFTLSTLYFLPSHVCSLTLPCLCQLSSQWPWPSLIIFPHFPSRAETNFGAAWLSMYTRDIWLCCAHSLPLSPHMLILLHDPQASVYIFGFPTGFVSNPLCRREEKKGLLNPRVSVWCLLWTYRMNIRNDHPRGW